MADESFILLYYFNKLAVNIKLEKWKYISRKFWSSYSTLSARTIVFISLKKIFFLWQDFL